MIIPIVWTVISVLVIAFTVFVQKFNWYGILLIIFCVLCVIVQWMVYFKKKRG